MTNSFCLRFAGTLLPRRAAWPGDNDSSRTAGNHRQRLWAKSVRGFHIERETERERERRGVYLNWQWVFIALVKLLITILHGVTSRLHYTYLLLAYFITSFIVAAHTKSGVFI